MRVGEHLRHPAWLLQLLSYLGSELITLIKVSFTLGQSHPWIFNQHPSLYESHSDCSSEKHDQSHIWVLVVSNYSPSPSQTLPTSAQPDVQLAGQPTKPKTADSFCLDSVVLLFSSVKSKPRWFQHWTSQLGFCLSFLDTSSHNNERQKKKNYSIFWCQLVSI